MRALLFASACAAAQIALCPPVFAQSADDLSARAGEDNEIVVTATRREERLQDVPLAITTFSQDELDEKGIVGYEGLAAETPGIVLNRASANFNNFTARGIATNGYGANLQSTVAIYVDELPISSNGNSTILDPSLYDVQRIEFLRGPQGTLFGSGSLAGALRIITNSPDPNAFDASFLADLGMTGSDSLRQRYNGMVNVPLVRDHLGLRVVGFVRDEEGYIDNIGTGVDNANTLESWGGRATLLWEPTDRLSVQLRFSKEVSEPQDASLENPLRGEDVRLTDRPDLFQGDMETRNITIGYQLDGASLTSSSTWTDYSALFYVDLAGTYAQAFPFALDADAWDEVFVQEARLVSDPGGRIDWVLGGFYYERQRDVDYNYRSRQDFLTARGITGLPDEYYSRSRAYSISHERAIFGELTYRFTEDLWTTAGLRYGNTDAQGFQAAGGYTSNYLTYAFFGLSGPLTLTPVAAATGAKVEEEGLSYRVSLSWRPTPSLTTYGAVATGFRGPLVNARAGLVSTIDPTDIVIPYGAESDQLINYEVGLKSRWFDNRLSANLAFYYIDWNDIQVQANRVSDSVQFATNIGGAVSRGVEFELGYFPTDSFSIFLNGSFNDAEVDSLTAQEAAISGAVSGARLSGPRVSGSLIFNYRFDAFANSVGNASVSVVHVDGFPNMFPNTPGRPSVPSPTYDETDAYTHVNANLAFAFDHFTLGAYVENLFDDRSVIYIHPEAFVDGRYGRLRPRTVGVRLKYDY